MRSQLQKSGANRRHLALKVSVFSISAHSHWQESLCKRRASNHKAFLLFIRNRSRARLPSSRCTGDEIRTNKLRLWTSGTEDRSRTILPRVSQHSAGEFGKRGARGFCRIFGHRHAASRVGQMTAELGVRAERKQASKLRWGECTCAEPLFSPISPTIPPAKSSQQQ